MYPNLNSGIGAVVARAMVNYATTGNVYIVGKAGLASLNDAQALFPAMNYDGSRVYHTTLDSAIGACTADRGDLILILPGHTETVSSATALAPDIAGITIVGLGRGTLRPTFTLDTATTATVAVGAANITIKNCLFVANFANIVSAFTLANAPGFTLEDVECRDTSAILNFLNIIDTNAISNNADDLTLTRVKRLGAGATPGTTIIKMDGTNKRLRVKDCYFAHLNVDDGGLFMPIALGKVVTDMEVDGCIFNFVGVLSTSAGVLITTDGTTNSGYIVRSFVKHLDATSEIMVTANSGFIYMDLKASAVADKQGYLVPAADA